MVMSDRKLDYESLKFSKEDWAEDKNWEVVSVWMLFKTTGLHGITKGMSIDNEEKRSKDTLLECSNIKKNEE